MKIVYKIYYITCKISFFLQYCLLDLLVGVVQPSVLWKVATLGSILSPPLLDCVNFVSASAWTMTWLRYAYISGFSTSLMSRVYPQRVSHES